MHHMVADAANCQALSLDTSVEGQHDDMHAWDLLCKPLGAKGMVSVDKPVLS